MDKADGGMVLLGFLVRLSFFLKGFHMLVLSRKPREQIVIGDNIRVVIRRVAGNRVTIGIDAPKEMRVIRGELLPKSASEGERDAA